MTDSRTPDEIEDEIERNRDSLQHTIEDLQNTFSPDNLFRSLSDNVREHGGDIGKSVSRAARENPLALAVTGIGLGWLIFGHGPSADRIEDRARRMRSNDRDDYDSTTGRTRTRAYGEGAELDTTPRGPVPDGSGPNWISDNDRGPSMSQRARAGWHNASRHVGDRSHAMADGASRGATRLRDRSEAAARSLSEGTEHMTHEARERIISAREAALEAGRRTGRSIQRGASRAGDRAGDFFEDHPIVAGALAFAVGAAIAGAMPRTRMEDDYFGEESDHLYDEAERIYEEERDKAARVASATLSEARKVGEEMRSDVEDVAGKAKREADNDTQGDGSAAQSVVDRIEQDARRISETAEEKAREEDLGRR